MSDNQYLYLITDGNKFKIGYSKNPKKRFLDYKLHNPTFIFKGIFKIPNKKYEIYIHMQLLKEGFKRSLGYKEWFDGKIENSYLEFLIKRIEEKEKMVKNSL